MKKIAVVILNYKVRELTLKAVQSVEKSDYPNLEIIVVDNNSGDNIEVDLEKYKNVKFIQSGHNLGYTGGNNIGIKEALGNNANFIFVLNPDATVEKNTISKLVGIYEKEKAGIVVPKIYFDNTKTIWYAGGKLDIQNVLGSHRGVDQKDLGQYENIEETDYATGCAFLISSELLRKVGLFDERYFLYYEDSDLSFRVKKAGYKILYVPSALVYHANAKSTGLGSPLQDYFITRNRMLFASKFLPFRTRFALFREALITLYYPTRRLALFDFLMGKFGKGSFLKN